MLLLADGAKNLIAVCVVVVLIVVIAVVVMLIYLHKQNGGMNKMGGSQEEEKEQGKQKGRKKERGNGKQRKSKGIAQPKPIEKLSKKALRDRVYELEAKLKSQEEQLKYENEQSNKIRAERDSQHEELEALRVRNSSLLLNQAEIDKWKREAAKWQTECKGLSNSVMLYKEKSEKNSENISNIISAMSEFLSRWNETCAELKVDATMSSSCGTPEDVCRIVSNEVSGALDRLKASCGAQKSLQEKLELLSLEMENIAASPSQSDSEDYMVWWQGVANDCYRFLGTMREEMGYNIMVPDSALREKGYGDIKANLDKFLDTILKEASKRRG